MAEKIEKFDEFNIVKTGSLLQDIGRMDMEQNEVPEIEVKEMIIKETGNFLNLKDNIINIPIEMIVFPFFTPQKQNKRVNFKYSFEDLGVTMFCTLVSKDNSDKVYQPSIFEEKIYTYLISMYELKKEINDTDDYIEFEISDFIVNFLGNKMNRNYYSKVEQALKNLKNTEYQFVISNHTKFGKYRFEDEEFKLLTYQKLKKGKKVYYRVTLNKNIRNKIKDKRYIKYNSKNYLEILEKDVVASRVYKYISKIRFNKIEDRVNVRTLAAIIPLKTEQIVTRETKDGIRTYELSRIKQVVKRIEKAYKVLFDLGYLENYETLYEKEEDNYYMSYKFNPEKDGECHISTYIDKSNKQVEYKWDKVNQRKKQNKNRINRNDVVEAEIVEEIKVSKEFSEKVQSKMIRAKKNIYVSKSWNKRTDNKIKRIIGEHGEDFAIEVLNRIYKKLNTHVKTTLVQYINGVIRNMKSEEKLYKKKYNRNNLTLFAQPKSSVVLKNKKSSSKLKLSKPTIKSIKDIINETNLSEDIMVRFEDLDDFEKLKIEEKALKICAIREKIEVSFLLTLKQKSKGIYMNTIKKYIAEVLAER